MGPGPDRGRGGDGHGALTTVTDVVVVVGPTTVDVVTDGDGLVPTYWTTDRFASSG